MGVTVHKNDKSGSVCFQHDRRENLNISCCFKFLEIHLSLIVFHIAFFFVCLCHFLTLHKTLCQSYTIVGNMRKVVVETGLCFEI